MITVSESQINLPKYCCYHQHHHSSKPAFYHSKKGRNSPKCVRLFVTAHITIDISPITKDFNPHMHASNITDTWLTNVTALLHSCS